MSAAGPPQGARPLRGRGEALPTQWASLGEDTYRAGPPQGVRLLRGRGVALLAQWASLGEVTHQ